MSPDDCTFVIRDVSAYQSMAEAWLLVAAYALATIVAEILASLIRRG